MPPPVGPPHPAAALPVRPPRARRPGRLRAAVALLALLLALRPAAPGAAHAAGPVPPAAAGSGDAGSAGDLEPSGPGLVVGDIAIRNGNIFDLDDPRENNWLFRLANRLHIRTRPSVIADQLLFRPGSAYDSRLLAESERLLRTNGFLYDARIQPKAVHDNQVDVEVWTRDVWTLRPEFSFERKGGANTTNISIEETNLLGRGSALRFSSLSSVDRNVSSLELADPHLLATRIAINLLLASTSDGWKTSVLVDRPFYALDTRRAAGILAVDDDRVDALYAGGEAVSRFRTRAKILRSYGGLSRGLRDGWIRRWTFAFTWDESRFSPAPGEPESAFVPADRVLAYPSIGLEILQDKFEKVRNLNKIGRTEDFYMGIHARAALGFAAPAFGADRRAVPFSALFEESLRAGARWTLTFAVAADGRAEGGTVRDTTLGASARQYIRLADDWLFYALLSGTRALRPDGDHQLLLGGDSGLRGYPLRYQAGDRRFLLTLEQRYFTEWYPFRLFRVGAAVFFDMGRAWGGNAIGAPTGTPDTGTLRDVGVGLRIGNARSNLGSVVHIDVAFPLDGDPSIAGTQFLVETKASF